MKTTAEVQYFVVNNRVDDIIPEDLEWLFSDPFRGPYLEHEKLVAMATAEAINSDRAQRMNGGQWKGPVRFCRVVKRVVTYGPYVELTDEDLSDV